jgi:hypothetical protein
MAVDLHKMLALPEVIAQQVSNTTAQNQERPFDQTFFKPTSHVPIFNR